MDFGAEEAYARFVQHQVGSGEVMSRVQRGAQQAMDMGSQNPWKSTSASNDHPSRRAA